MLWPAWRRCDAGEARKMESLFMNARVFLLILVTSVFMAVWDSDQKAMNAALARKSRLRPAMEQVTKMDEPEPAIKR